METLVMGFCSHCGQRVLIIDDDWTLLDNHVTNVHERGGRR